METITVQVPVMFAMSPDDWEPLPEPPAGWGPTGSRALEYNGGQLELSLWSATGSYVKFWEVDDEFYDSVTTIGPKWEERLAELGLDDDTWEQLYEYARALFERLDADVYSASSAVLNAVRPLILARHLPSNT
jgi:hypothetical protein